MGAAVYYLSTKIKRRYEKAHNTLILWSQRAELNRRPTDYELQIGVFRKLLITGWFLLSAYFSDSFRRSINSITSIKSVLLDNFYHKFIIVDFLIINFDIS